MKKFFYLTIVMTLFFISCSPGTEGNKGGLKTEFKNKEEVKDYVEHCNSLYNTLKEGWGPGTLGEPILDVNNTGDNIVKVTWNNVHCNGEPVKLCFDFDPRTPNTPIGIYKLHSFSNSFPEYDK